MKHEDIVYEIDCLASEIKTEIKNDRYKKMKGNCSKLCEKHSELSILDGYLGFPKDMSLPFFAYGIFKPGQVAYHMIKDFVESTDKVHVDYTLYERDGIPIVFKEHDERKTYGYIIRFKQNDSFDAYDRIRKTESKTFYKWASKPLDINGERVNMLFGKKHENSNPIHVDEEYDGLNDVFFKDAIRLISKDMENYSIGNTSFENFIKLQRNYMLLWAAIERYTSLKYGENSKAYNNEQLSNEKCFQSALKFFVKTDDDNKYRVVFNSQDLKPNHLNPDDPKKAIKYYYTMRSNVIHRGKSVVIVDEENLRKSLLELLMIFQFVLKNTFKDYRINEIDYKIGGIGINNKLTLVNI